MKVQIANYLLADIFCGNRERLKSLVASVARRSILHDVAMLHAPPQLLIKWSAT